MKVFISKFKLQNPPNFSQQIRWVFFWKLRGIQMTNCQTIEKKTPLLLLKYFHPIVFCMALIPIEVQGNVVAHGLRTPNEGINQRNLKIWADVADKICFGRT